MYSYTLIAKEPPHISEDSPAQGTLQFVDVADPKLDGDPQKHCDAEHGILQERADVLAKGSVYSAFNCKIITTLLRSTGTNRRA